MRSLVIKPWEEKVVKVDNFEELEVEVPRGASLRFVFSLTGAGSRRAKFFLHDDARLELFGNFRADDNGEINLVTEAIHAGVRSWSRTKVKGLLTGSSKVKYDGWIKILPQAHQSDAFLEQRALILDQGCEAKLSPLLEIRSDDVKASHAASVGKINEDEIFYLTSRGIDRQEAIKLIAQGQILFF